jgi:glycosyltransferase involved in cell wall biosynthesis
MCRRADAILVVSEFLKSQAIEWFHADPRKITVVGNGIDPCFYEEGKKPDIGLDSDSPYVLCVGGLNFLDGGDRAVAVAGLLRKVNSKIRILVAGRQHDKEKVALAKALGNVELLGYVPSDRLAPLMRNAIALLYLTRYETFGMAAAEAMAAGCPVVTCRSTAVPEIVGNAGIYVNPDQPHEAVDVIMDLSCNASKRAEYITRGKQAASKYTWEACVTRLQHALSGGR